MPHHRDLIIPGDPSFVIANARIPSAFVVNAPPGARRDDEDALLLDLAIERGVVATLAPAGGAPRDGRPVVDVAGRMVWPTLIDMHAHLDKGQSIPRAKPDGTIVTGATGTAADRAHWSDEDIRVRMEFGVRCAHVHGVAAIRTHIDSNHDLTERAWRVFRALREEWSPRVALQGVGLAPLDLFLGEAGPILADLVAESGGVLGGVTDGIGDDWGDTSRLDAALDAYLTLAAARGLDVDLHVDQTDDVIAFALPRIAEAVLRNRFRGRVVCGHCVNLALQPDDVLRRALELAGDAGLTFVTMPTPMMYLMDRKPGRTPRWRGVTAAIEIRDAGLPIAIGGDNCRDAWFAYGDHDMVDTFQQAVRVFQLDHPHAPNLAMAGPTPALIAGFGGAGTITAGSAANLILFAARDFSEFMARPQADRIVLHRGRRVSDALPDYSELDAITRR